MISEVLVFAAVTYLLMLAAYRWHHVRAFHIPVMVGVMTVDLLIPVYLVFTRDWYRRLIVQEEIFSFMIWMHLIMVLSLYGLYALQIQSGLRLLRGDDSLRTGHRAQAIGILLVRGLIIVSSILLIEPPQVLVS